MILERKPGKAFNALSVGIGLALLAVWVFCISMMALRVQVRTSQELILLGFGAVFTLFLLKFVVSEPAVSISSLVGILGGTALFRALGSPQSPLLTGLEFLVLCFAVGGAVWLGLRLIMPRRFNLRPEELAVIYTIIVIGSATALVSRGTIHAAAEFWRAEYQLEKWVPPQFLPAPGEGLPDAAVDPSAPPDKGLRRGMLEGRSRVPFLSWFVTGGGRLRPIASWTFPAAFWIILVLSFEFLLLAVALTFRRRWIEEERLPFPFAQMPLTIIGDGAAEASRSLFRRPLPTIAFAAGFLMTAASVLSITPTEVRSVNPLQFLFFEGISTRIQLPANPLIPLEMGILWLVPLGLVVMMFVPIEVLMTALLTFFVTRVLVHYVGNQLGYGTLGYPDRMTRGLAVGGTAGLAFWTLFFNRREIARLFTGFFRRTRSASERRWLNIRNLLLLFWALAMAWSIWVYPTIYGAGLTPLTRWLFLAGTGLLFLYVILSSRNDRVDPDDPGPIGARGLFILIAAMGLAFVALTLPGRSVSLLLASLALIFAYTFGSMRARAEVPHHEFYEYDSGRMDAAIQARYLPGPSDGETGFSVDGNRWWNTPSGLISHWYSWHFVAAFRRWAPHNHFLDTFKIGHETGAAPRDILKALLLAMILAAVVTPPLTLAVSYKYGYGGSNIPMYWYEDYVTNTGRSYIFGTSSMEPPRHLDQSPLYTWPLACFVLTGVIMYLRREYVWFPLHPVGFVMAGWMYQASGLGSMRDQWFTVLVAWFLKRMIFKWFGVRFFREKVQPVLVFVAMGLVLGTIIFLARFAIELGIGWFKHI